MKIKYSIANIFALVIVACCFVFTLTSCGKKKYTKEQTKIERYLSERNFDKAREVAMGIPPKAKYVNSEGEWSYIRNESLDKINTAQLSTFIAAGELEDAEALANELDVMPVFWKLVEKNLSKLYGNNFHSLYSLLTRYPFTTTYYEKLVDFFTPDFSYAQEYASKGIDHFDSKKYYYSTNVGYNDEISKNNKLVMQVINMAILDNNVECIKKMMLLLKPEAVEVSRVKSRKNYPDYATITYKLENTAAKEVKEKARQAGVNL